MRRNYLKSMSILLSLVLSTGLMLASTLSYGATTTLTAGSGSFDDGSGTLKYLNNLDSRWLIQPSGVVNVTLQFSAFQTEAVYDYVVVYDGADITAPVLGTFSGSSLPSSLTSTGGQMLVRFITNRKTVYNGWTASYTSTPAFLQLNQTNVTATNTAGRKTIMVNTNLATYDVTENYDWITTEKYQDSIVINYQNNALTSSRVANITVSGNYIANQTITLTQDPTVYYMNIEPTYHYVAAGQGSVSSYITTNVTSYTLDENYDWVDITRVGNTINISYQANPNLTPRTAQILINGYGISNKSITINQEATTQGYFSIDNTEATVTADIDTAFFHINTNQPVTITKYDSWVNTSFDGETLMVIFDANLTNTPNEALIELMSPAILGVTTLMIRQQAKLTQDTDTIFAHFYGFPFAPLQWLIKPTNADSIRISSFSLYSNGDGTFKIYDGSTTSAPIIAEFDESNIPNSVTSSTGEVLVEIAFDTPYMYDIHFNFIYDSYINGELPMPRSLTQNEETLSIKENEATNFSVSPNPCNSNLNIKLGKDAIGKDYPCQVVDVTGKVMLNQQSNGMQSIDFDLSKLASGVYMVKINTDKLTMYKKIFKQ